MDGNTLVILWGKLSEKYDNVFWTLFEIVEAFWTSQFDAYGSLNCNSVFASIVFDKPYISFIIKSKVSSDSL